MIHTHHTVNDNLVCSICRSCMFLDCEHANSAQKAPSQPENQTLLQIVSCIAIVGVESLVVKVLS